MKERMPSPLSRKARAAGPVRSANINRPETNTDGQNPNLVPLSRNALNAGPCPVRVHQPARGRRQRLK